MICYGSMALNFRQDSVVCKPSDIMGNVAEYPYRCLLW